jgi:hypothetical protein
VTSSQEDFHLQVNAHAGRTKARARRLAAALYRDGGHHHEDARERRRLPHRLPKQGFEEVADRIGPQNGAGVQRKFHALMSDDQFMCDLTRLKELRSFLIQEAVLWMVPGSAGYESVPHNLED